MKKKDKSKQQILELAGRSGIVSAAEVRSRGIHSEYLRQLCDEGRIIRIERGLYRLPDAEVAAQHGLVQVSKSVPGGILCLLSALRFHEIGTQIPHEAWLAIERRAARPRNKQIRMRIVRFSGKAFTEGIGEHVIEGEPVRIYSPAKTVADCFKYRNKIGLDVALEALKDVLRSRTCSTDELWKYAKVCRVTRVMRPYMEATV